MIVLGLLWVCLFGVGVGVRVCPFLFWKGGGGGRMCVCVRVRSRVCWGRGGEIGASYCIQGQTQASQMTAHNPKPSYHVSRWERGINFR